MACHQTQKLVELYTCKGSSPFAGSLTERSIRSKRPILPMCCASDSVVLELAFINDPRFLQHISLDADLDPSNWDLTFRPDGRLTG